MSDGRSQLFTDPENGDYSLAASSTARKFGFDTTATPTDVRCDAGAPGGLPKRPLSVRTNAAKLKFRHGESARFVELVADGDKFERPFTIVKNFDFDWFAVTPVSGILKTGQRIQLEVRLKPEKFRNRPLMRGAFLVRFPDGLSRPVSVYAETDWKMPFNPHKPNGFCLYLNPEKAVKAGTFPRGEEMRGPEQDGWLRLPERTMPASAESTELMTFEFTVPRDGYYHFFLRANGPAPSGAHDSMFYGIDQKPLKRIDFLPGITESPRWIKLGISGRQVTKSSEYLRKGRHQLRLSPRETTNIGLIAVTDNPFAFEPKD